MELVFLIIWMVINYLLMKFIFKLGYMQGHFDGHKHEQENPSDPVSKLLTGGKKCKNHKWARDENDDLRCVVCGKGIQI